MSSGLALASPLYTPRLTDPRAERVQSKETQAKEHEAAQNVVDSPDGRSLESQDSLTSSDSGEYHTAPESNSNGEESYRPFQLGMKDRQRVVQPKEIISRLQDEVEKLNQRETQMKRQIEDLREQLFQQFSDFIATQEEFKKYIGDLERQNQWLRDHLLRSSSHRQPHTLFTPQPQDQTEEYVRELEEENRQLNMKLKRERMKTSDAWSKVQRLKEALQKEKESKAKLAHHAVGLMTEVLPSSSPALEQECTSTHTVQHCKHEEQHHGQHGISTPQSKEDSEENLSQALEADEYVL